MVSNKSDETEKPLCVIDYNHNKGSRFEGPVATHAHGRDKKLPNDTSNFSKLYSSQFVCCSSTSYRNIQQLSYRIQLVEGLFMKYELAVETRGVAGHRYPTTQFHG